MAPFLPISLTDDDTPDPAAMLADLAAETAPDRPIEVFAGRGKGRVCFLSPSILSAGLPALQSVLGPGEWRIAVRRADGRLTSAALPFEGRPRPILFASPHYIAPDPADLAGPRAGAPSCAEVDGRRGKQRGRDRRAQEETVRRDEADHGELQGLSCQVPRLSGARVRWARLV